MVQPETVAADTAAREHGRWWREGIVYQIYPRSFLDTNGDGIGDLRGIINKLDYLQALGITIVWLNPIYASPNDDNGYDISDYESIMAEFGTMADFEELLHGLHERGIRLIMDLVVNHSSDEHAWFVESRRSRDNPHRDFYIWRDGVDTPAGEQPPNNWRSFFSGSTWEKDAATGQYYLHLFSRKQPDLNWEHPPVREAVYDMMNRWFDMGIDGFRMDVINLLSKVPGLPSVPDTPPGELAWGGRYFVNGPRLHEFLQEMHQRTLAGRDVMTVGECVAVDVAEGRKLVGQDRGELDMIFQMEHMDLDSGPLGKWDIKQPWSRAELKSILGRWIQGLHGDGWNSQFWTNHDQPRTVSRFGNDSPEWREKSALALAALPLTLPGTPYIYQGDEIGMTNVAFPIEDYRDLETLNWYREEVARGRDPAALMPAIHFKSRDNARTPMQWDDSAQAGFTSGTPWLRINPDYAQINVAEAMARPGSVWHGFRELIELRKANPGLAYAELTWLWPEHEALVVFRSRHQQQNWLIALNLHNEPQTLPTELPPVELWLWSNEPLPSGPVQSLAPWQALVGQLPTASAG
ncbi:alpha-glucosidase [Natronospirillum operosum]|uniref:Alpha-glucosidase n=1 Tax=Natronospirillum operosum TaxID=2759953 RepID=A0A4Z0WA95_9GAMM|nr:alpha-glucosidase [Natronospirillum operosum]TGG92496.1 alpha-glucosidase [Natronospirillum operosum]